MAAKRIVLGNQDASGSSLAEENSLKQSIAHIHLQTSQQANVFSLSGESFYWLKL